MRLFTAIDLPAELTWKLERLLSLLRPEALIKWSPLDNLHVTTKFIGEWPQERVGELEAALAELPPRESFTIELRDLGWYPNERSPRVLWAGVHAPSALAELARDTEQLLASRFGIPVEDRPFSPHLTLARIKNPVPLNQLRRKVDELQPAAMGSFIANHFRLYRSDPGSQSSIYRSLRSFNFEKAFVARDG
jgi:RNA 2',3'-cyclic 3'-phosphodiesterase